MKNSQIVGAALIMILNVYRIHYSSFQCTRSSTSKEEVDLQCDPTMVIGYAVYLNAFQFRHTCYRPDLCTKLDGQRVVVYSIDRSEKNDSDQRPKFHHAKTFKRLTMDWSRNSALPNNGYLVTTRERIANIPIDCRCDMCRDLVKMELEEFASIMECDECKQPYVWCRGTSVAKSSCQCRPKDKKTSMDEDKETLQIKLMLLNIQWAELVVRVSKFLEPSRAIMLCESLLMTAKRYWHPLINLRIARIQCVLFNAHYSFAYSARNEGGSFIQESWAVSGLGTGERMLESLDYDGRPEDFDHHRATIYAQMAVLSYYAMEWNGVSSWCSKAIKIYEIYEDTQGIMAAKNLTNIAKEMSAVTK